MKENMKDLHLALAITEHARQHPGHTAISSENCTVSYHQLEESSNQWANCLNRRIKETPNREGNRVKSVMIILDRSPELIQCIIGVLKAGLVFVPVTPFYPAQRIQLLIDETQPCCLVTSLFYYEKFKAILDREEIRQKLVLADGEDKNDQGIDMEKENRELDFTCIYNKYSYIYFTSGSTGVPKGVLGRNKSLVHFIDWEIEEFGVNENFKVSQFTNPSFDPYLRDIFVPLMAGATCCIPGNNILMNPILLLEWIGKQEITLSHIVPSLFKALLEEIENPGGFDKLRYILLAGELLRGKDIERFFKIFKDKVQLVNVYGPTETTLAKFFYKITPKDVNRVFVPVGKPLPNVQALVLDENMQKCLIGNIGEVYIRTPFLSSGYYNSPDLTKKKFLRNPFNDNPQDIIYKTGDQGRLLEDGTLELLGRIDDQVKIRGMRLEPGEVENQLLGYPGIKETVVLPHRDGNDNLSLCAYIIPKNGKEFKIPELKSFLANQLPAYMIPSHFILVDNIPLSPNGKIDKGALPPPPQTLKQIAAYEAPQNELQKSLEEMWRSLLKIEKIGINDNFFDLGGESLSLMRLIGNIYKDYDVSIPLMQMFKRATIKEISLMITEKKFEEDPYILLGRTSDLYGKDASAAPRKNIFCFPPAQGFGLQYGALALHLQEYSFYAFNFLEDMPDEQRLNQYIEIITEIQDHDPYILMGWSAGGALSFQTANKLEKQGRKVTDIILIDSPWNPKLKQENHTEIRAESLANIIKFLESLGIGHMKSKVENRMRQYVRYNKQLLRLEPIGATVHFITSSERKNIEETAAWNNYTTAPLLIYNGVGLHNQMFEPGFVDRNAQIVKQILDKIFCG